MHQSLATVPLLYVVLIAYGTVLTAELVGDKSIYTVSSLVLRFPTAVVVGAMAGAFAVKMSVAVLLGGLLTRIPPLWMSLVSVSAFLVSATFIWLDEDEDRVAPRAGATSFLRAAAICFAALFVPEWGDPGQIVAAALTVQAGSPLGPWLGGTLALCTKGLLALTIGVRLRDRLPRRRLRLFASVSCCTLAVVTLANLARSRI